MGEVPQLPRQVMKSELASLSVRGGALSLLLAGPLTSMVATDQTGSSSPDSTCCAHLGFTVVLLWSKESNVV